MDLLDQMTQLFMRKYGASPEEARRQAAFFINRGSDEMAASFISEARQFSKQTEAKNTAEAKANAAARPVPSQFDLTEPGSKRLAKPSMPPAPIPSVPTQATPEHVDDSNIAAWQRYSQMLDAADSIKVTAPAGDPARGLPSGGRRRY